MCIRDRAWDDTLLKALDIPRCILPRGTDSSDVYGTTDRCGVQIPVAGIAGDQQAALFGQSCFGKGEAKNTYGTSLGTPTTAMPKRAMRDKFFSILLFILLEGL